jgi:hypothetical protein
MAFVPKPYFELFMFYYSFEGSKVRQERLELP